MPASALSNLEPSAAIGFLLQVLSSAANGSDISSVVPELIQVVFSRPATNATVRKLAYEVCRNANLTDAEYRSLWECITSDTNSNDAEVVAAALRFVPSLPASELAARLVVGQLSEVLKPCLTAGAATVRAAAVTALSHVLLVPEVQQAAAGSQGLAIAYEGLWDELTDALLDERPFVVGLAAAATAKLLEWGIARAAAGLSGVYGDADEAAAAPAGASLSDFMMSRFADRAAQRLSAALGPVLDMCGLVPAPGQVAVCGMLLALTRRMLTHTLRASAGCPAPPVPPGVPVPNLASLVATVSAYLSTLLQAGDAGARTEACGAVLALAADLAAAGPAAGGAAAGLSQALVLEAAQALTQLREREFVEAGLADMCEAVAGALPALLPSARALVLRRLWPLASRVEDVSRRARIFSAAWRAAVATEMDYRTGAGGEATATGGLLAARPVATTPPPASGSGSGADGLAGLLGDLAAGATVAGSGNAAAADACVVAAVPASCRVAAQLQEHYMELLMAGKAPTMEASGAFAAAQASAAAAVAPPSPSLLSSVTTPRAAPPPPPLSVPRAESNRSIDSGQPALDSAKASKPEKKGGVFGGLFSRSKGKGKGEAEPDRGPAHEEASQAVATAAREEEAASAVATAQRAAAGGPAAPPAPPSPGRSSSMRSPTTSANGGAPPEARSTLSTSSVPIGDPSRPSTYATLRHELLQCLLWQVAHHPAAAVAAELCAELAAAERHDRRPPTHSHPTDAASASASPASGPAVGPARRLAVIAQWVGLAGEVLSESAACAAWEPYVFPAITSQPSAAAAGRVPLDFNNLTVDLWLALLQAALQAARAAQATLGRLVVEAVEAAAAAMAAAAQGAGAGGQFGAYGGMGYGMPYGMTPGVGAGAGAGVGGAGVGQQQQEVTSEMYYRALLAFVKQQADALQGLVVRLLTGWSGLSAAARPRVAWVAAHAVSLPGHWDDQWELLLGCLDSLLLRSTDVLASSRRHDILGSALAGSLLRAGRQAWTDPSKPFLFDIAAASALCEAPEYEVLGLLVALAALQHLVARLVNAIAEAVPKGAAGAAHGQAAAVARRVETIMRHFIGTEVAAAPHVRDWCKRILRALSTIMTYAPPTNLPPTVAALGVIAKQAHEADGTAGAGPADDDDSSSDASSAYNPDEAQTELPPALAAAAAAMAKAAAATATSAAASHGQQLEAPEAEVTAVNGANGVAAAQGGEGAADGAAAANDAAKARGTHSYLVHSAVTAVPMWGYPFAPLSAAALQNAKRARRHRALLTHLSAAAAAAEAPRPAATAAQRALHPPEEVAVAGSSPPAAGPALSCRTQYRLDSESFWVALPSTHSRWQELTGPADPLLLRACYLRPDAAQSGLGTLTVLLSAVNRLPVDLGDVELSIKTNGPLLSNSRRVVTWELPRLAPHDRASTSCSFKILGYGEMQLHIRLQLCPGPARTDTTPMQLNCLPLEVPCTVLLRPPRVVPDAGDFFKAWAALPARAELSGVCTWPGPDGGALLLSALLRQPLGCPWLQHVAAVCGFQAAFVADTATHDSLALVVMTQMMPPAVQGGSVETFCTVSVRSSCPELILAVQSSASAWLTQITAGTASLGSAGRQAQPSPTAKPPMHPRVAALLQSYVASAAQLASLASTGSFGGVSVEGPGGSRPGDQGTTLLKNAAVLEWQRLSSLAA